MNKQITTIGLLALIGVGVLLLLKKKQPNYQQMKEELWQHFLKDSPATAPYKNEYLSTSIWQDRGYIRAWYKAYKSGQDTFTYNNKQFQTKNGLEL